MYTSSALRMNRTKKVRTYIRCSACRTRLNFILGPALAFWCRRYKRYVNVTVYGHVLDNPSERGMHAYVLRDAPE